MQEYINILHISDLHFGLESQDTTEIAKRKNVLCDFISTLENFIKTYKNNKIDILAITGDIAWKAKREDYIEAELWINDFKNRFSIQHIVVCPGNHDIDRDIAEEYAYITSSSEADKLLSIKRINRRKDAFLMYSQFCKNIGVEPYIFNNQKQEHYLYGVSNVLGINFIVLNSAWNCRGKNDKGNLWLGLPQIEVMKACDLNSSNNFSICLFHHPYEWFNEYDILKYENRKPAYQMMQDMSNIVLNGHNHSKSSYPDIKNEGTLIYTVGSLYDSNSHWNSFELLQLNINKKNINQVVFEYNPMDAIWTYKKFNTINIGKRSENSSKSIKGLEYYQDRGVIINPNDNQRNIALKVKTFNEIFDCLYSSLEEGLIKNNERQMLITENYIDDIIFKCGYSCGCNFGNFMEEAWRNEKRILSIEEKITRWCNFDSAVGWGKFTHNIQFIEEDNSFIGFLVINENFQARSIRKYKHKICNFIKGYCTGVLEEITIQQKLDLICCDDKCPRKGNRDNKCIFIIKVVE